MPVRRPDLRALPRADREFQREVDRLYADWTVGSPSEAQSAEAFEAVLRRAYPTATVRPQDSLATFGSGRQVWYINRRDLGIPAETLAEAPAGASTAAGEGPGSAPIYSASRVAHMVGVPVSVVVAWETDGLVRPFRTPGQLPLYSRDQLEAMLFAKRAFVEGHTVDEVRRALEERAARGAVPTGADRGRAPRLLVLLAERDRFAAELTEYFLRTEGYEVEVALSAQEAEVRATELEPQLAVVELLISGGSGAELCARLKTRPGATVLAISSLDAGDAALRAGADAFLAKPYDELTFVSVVKDLLGESALLRGANRPSGSDQ